jgi:hypothetical protein
VLSTLNCEFRLGLRFLEFQSGDQAILQRYLDWRGAGNATAGTGGAKPRAA